MFCPFYLGSRGFHPAASFKTQLCAYTRCKTPPLEESTIRDLRIAEKEELLPSAGPVGVWKNKHSTTLQDPGESLYELWKELVQSHLQFSRNVRHMNVLLSDDKMCQFSVGLGDRGQELSKGEALPSSTHQTLESQETWGPESTSPGT